MSAEAKSCLPRSQNSDRARGARARGQSASPDRVQGSRIAVRDARPAPPPNVKGPSAERPLTSEFPRRSRTVSPSRRSNYRPRDTSNTNKGPSGNNKDTTNTTNNKQNQKRNKIGSDQHNKKKTNENRCLSLIDEVSNKILEANDELNAADVKVLGDRLTEKLMKGVKTANEAEPSKLYREDSTYRIIKSSHQHQKVMQHCGIKKQKNKMSETNVKTNLNSKSRYDSDCVEFSANTDDWTGVPRDAEKKCDDVSADITPKISKKSSVNKKKSCDKKLSTPKLSKENKELLEFAKSQDFNREDKIDTVEDILSVEDYNTWKKLPEAVDKLMNYIDGMANKEAEPGNEIVKTDKTQKPGKKGNLVKDRREKIKLWDLQRRLTLGLKLETRAQERKCDQNAEQSGVDGNSGIDSSNDDICFGVYHDSKVNMFNPDNTGPLYEGIFSGGDIRPNKQSRVSTKDTPLRAQRCQKPRSPTTTQWTSFVSHYD